MTICTTATQTYDRPWHLHLGPGLCNVFCSSKNHRVVTNCRVRTANRSRGCGNQSVVGTSTQSLVLKCDGSSFHGDEPSMVCSMPKPLGSAGLWTGQKPWTRHLSLTVAAFSCLFSLRLLPFQDWFLSPLAVAGGCSTVLEQSACSSLCQVLLPENIEGWVTLHHEPLHQPPPPHTSVCTALVLTECCFLPPG